MLKGLKKREIWTPKSLRIGGKKHYINMQKQHKSKE